MKFVLASGSPRRRELLSLVIDEYDVVPADIDEDMTVNENPMDYVCRMAYEKAAAVAVDYQDSIVIGCDTVVELDGEILSKPADEKQAFSILKKLSGNIHNVMTAVTIFRPLKSNENFPISFVETTKVEFWDLSEKQIYLYISCGESFDKAGGYGIQGKGALLVKSICGDYFNVVGLPVSMLSRKLDEWGC